jgi:hypothetical protein
MQGKVKFRVPGAQAVHEENPLTGVFAFMTFEISVRVTGGFPLAFTTVPNDVAIQDKSEKTARPKHCESK